MWKRLNDLPVGIVNHQALYINNLIYIFGGDKISETLNYEKISVFVSNPNSQYIVLALSCKTFYWTCNTNDFTTAMLGVEEPYDCYGHTVVKWERLGVLFGGCKSNSELGYCPSKIYLFVSNWHCLPSELRHRQWMIPQNNYWVVVNGIGGNSPVKRDGHAATVWQDKMFVYGGLLGCENKYLDNKVYQLDFIVWQWTIVYNGEFVEPIGRDFCSLTLVQNSFYMFGGRSDDGIFELTHNDIYDTAMWRFDFGFNSWRKVHPGFGIICNSSWMHSSSDHNNNESSIRKYSKFPFPRRSHMSDIFQKEIIIFGGLYETNSFSVHLNDLWSFNIATNEWTLLSQQNESMFGINTPPTLRRGTLTLINKHVAVLVGGVTTSVNSTRLSQGTIMGSSLIFERAGSMRHYNGVTSLCASNYNSISSIVLYENPHVTFSGSITMTEDLSLQSVNKMFLLQPKLTLYERALILVAEYFSIKELINYSVPHSIISDVKAFQPN